MTIDAYKELIEARPTPTPEQYADARRYVLRECPDLYAAIFGESA